MAKFLHADNEYWSDCANLSLRWAHMSEGTFSYDMAFMYTRTWEINFYPCDAE